MPVSVWREGAGEVAREGPCWIGTDLAQTRDLTAVARLWQTSRHRWAADFRCWIPEATFTSLDRRRRPLYERARESGVLRVTPGTVTSTGEIGDYIRLTAEEFGITQIGMDPYNASELYTGLEADGLPVMMVRQNISTMSAPSKEVESLVLDKRIAHDGDEFIAWQVESAHAYRDVNENLKIRKGEDEHAKVDAVIALIMARAVADPNAAPEANPSIRFLDFDADFGEAA